MDLVHAEKRIIRAWVLSVLAILAFLVFVFLGNRLDPDLQLFMPWFFSGVAGFYILLVVLLLTFLVYRKSRTGAILFFAFYVFERFLAAMLFYLFSNLFIIIWVCLSLIWGFVFFESIRGTFAYHRLKSATNQVPRDKSNHVNSNYRFERTADAATQAETLASANTLNLEQLNSFSQTFFNDLLQSFPELANKAVIDENENGLPGSILVKFAPDASRPSSIFSISTHNGEVTVGFDEHHDHFDWPEEETTWQMNAISFIDALLKDRVLVVIRKKAGKFACSRVIQADEEVDLSSMENDDVVYLRSWSGRLDRVLTKPIETGQPGA